MSADALLAEMRTLAVQQEALVRRFGDLAEELLATQKRIDRLNQRIDMLRDELGKRVEQVTARVETMSTDVSTRLDALIVRTDSLYLRIAGQVAPGR